MDRRVEYVNFPHADSLKIPPKINKGQKRTLCYLVLFNHIRQMAPVVDADAKSLVSAGDAARRGAHAGLCHASSAT